MPGEKKISSGLRSLPSIISRMAASSTGVNSMYTPLCALSKSAAQPFSQEMKLPPGFHAQQTHACSTPFHPAYFCST